MKRNVFVCVAAVVLLVAAVANQRASGQRAAAGAVGSVPLF